MGAILRSRIHFDADETSLAIEALEQIVAAPDDRPAEPTPFSLEHYLLALLYTLAGDEDTALDSWSAIDDWIGYWMAPLESDPEVSNATSVATWLDLYARCPYGPREWGTETSPCLPADLAARIDAVYGLFQDQLLHRLYYQNRRLGVPACPYVFTRDPGSQTWRRDTTILYTLVGPESETFQRRSLTRFDGWLLVRELEPERSYIDVLYVLLADHAGHRMRLQPQSPVLQTADNHYLVLNPGDEILLSFDGYEDLPAPRQVWVVAKGYYIPLTGRPRDPGPPETP
jgi:hypothetical protein